MIAKIINEKHDNQKIATAVDAGAVTVCPPVDPHKLPAQFIAEIGLLEVRPDMPARIVINERTGTLVAGENVTIGLTAVSHGNLYIGIGVTPVVSQPTAFSGGETVVVPRTQISSSEERRRMIVVPKSTTVAEVARALNALGVTPRDLIAIFQSLKQAGALYAELVII